MHALNLILYLPQHHDFQYLRKSIIRVPKFINYLLPITQFLLHYFHHQAQLKATQKHFRKYQLRVN